MISDVFYSELHIRKDDEVLIVDARTSDAVALAVRSDAPIYISAEILEIVGTVVEAPAEKTEVMEVELNAEDLSNEELDLLNITDLEELLSMALHEEKYELAVNIRDALKRKEEK
jgi:bifunctional DNase/RNase